MSPRRRNLVLPSNPFASGTGARSRSASADPSHSASARLEQVVADLQNLTAPKRRTTIAPRFRWIPVVEQLPSCFSGAAPPSQVSLAYGIASACTGRSSPPQPLQACRARSRCDLRRRASPSHGSIHGWRPPSSPRYTFCAAPPGRISDTRFTIARAVPLSAVDSPTSSARWISATDPVIHPRRPSESHRPVWSRDRIRPNPVTHDNPVAPNSRSRSDRTLPANRCRAQPAHSCRLASAPTTRPNIIMIQRIKTFDTSPRWLSARANPTRPASPARRSSPIASSPGSCAPSRAPLYG